VRRRFAAPALLLAAAAAVAPCAAPGQQAVLVVRHAEKISDEDERLTEAGRARALRLAQMLKKAGVDAIYSTDTERTIGTAKPLADGLGLMIRLYDAAPVEGVFDFKPFAERLRREVPRGIALVVGHSNTVSPLLGALGCAEEVSIADDEFDNLFVVVPTEPGKATLVRLRY
jgi:broad specificity phosphatase PhoE